MASFLNKSEPLIIGLGMFFFVLILAQSIKYTIRETSKSTAELIQSSSECCDTLVKTKAAIKQIAEIDHHAPRAVIDSALYTLIESIDEGCGCEDD